MNKKNNSYDKKLRKILKTYNSILVKCKNIPNLVDKNIIMVDDINSMINAQIEVRKPIVYYQEARSISLILIDSTEAYIFILKENATSVSEAERIIQNIDIARKNYIKDILNGNENRLLNSSINQEKLLTTNEQILLNESNNFTRSDKEDNIDKYTNTQINEYKPKEIKEAKSESKYLIPVNGEKNSMFIFFNRRNKRKYGKHS